MDKKLLDLAESFYDQITDGDGYTHTESEVSDLVAAGLIECDKDGHCRTTDKLHQALDGGRHE